MQGGFQNALHALYGLPGGFITDAPEVVDDGGIYVANKYDPFPKRLRKRKKGKFLTTQEIEDNKWAKKKEEEEFLLLFTDDYDD